MDANSRILRLVLAVCAGVVLLAGIVGVATHDKGKDDSGSLTAGGGSTTTVELAPVPGQDGTLPLDTVPGATTTTAPGTKPTTTAKGGGTATTASTATTAKQGTPPAASITAPKIGKFLFHVKANGQESDQTTTVEGGPACGTGGTNLTITLPAPDGSSLRNSTGWSSAGALVCSSVITMGSVTLDCDWSPDFLQYKAPMKAGLQWSSQPACTATASGIKVNISMSQTAVITKASSYTIEGQAISTWQITRHSETHAEAPLMGVNMTIVSDSTEEFSPAYGLPLFQHAKTTGGQQGPVESDTVLKSLTPSP